jgi:uncharacterized protein YpuA (DUF1002 family)
MLKINKNIGKQKRHSKETKKKKIINTVIEKVTLNHHLNLTDITIQNATLIIYNVKHLQLTANKILYPITGYVC